MSDLRWRLKPDGPDGKEYVFDAEMLTLSALRRFKAEFGNEIGRYLSFISALGQGDPDAALTALWLAKQAAGETNVPEPNQMPDFSMSGFMEFIGDTGKDADPTQAEEPQTPSSTETPTNSESATSDS